MKKRLALLFGFLMLATMVALAADASGNWVAAAGTQGAPQRLQLTANGATVSGAADTIAISGGKVQGNTVWFTVVRDGIRYEYKGSYTDSQLKLFESKPGTPGARTITFNRQ